MKKVDFMLKELQQEKLSFGNEWRECNSLKLRTSRSTVRTEFIT